MAGIKLELQSKNKAIPCGSGLNHAIESFPFEFSDAPCSSTWPDGKLFAGWHETNPYGEGPEGRETNELLCSGSFIKISPAKSASRLESDGQTHLDDRVAESKSPYWTPIGH
jgi:hypothetical protein